MRGGQAWPPHRERNAVAVTGLASVYEVCSPRVSINGFDTVECGMARGSTVLAPSND